MEQKELKRKQIASAARERRKKSRKKILRIEKTILALAGVIIICGGTLTVWNLIPNIKIAKQLEAADEFVEAQSYEEAIASCEEALKIDSKSVKAYRAMAGVYLTREDRATAEQVLYQGWETTGDKSLLKEYCVHLLNDAVSDINTQNCSLDTFNKCVLAMEQGQSLDDCYKLLDACYGYLFGSENTELLYEVDGEGVCGFERYLDILNRMLVIYESSPTEELKAEIIKYAAPESSLLWLRVEDLKDYSELIQKVNALASEGTGGELAACLDKAIWVQDTFAEAFEIFDSGEFEAIKDFMQTDTYISIRDKFVDGTMEYWKGQTYIPISREKIKLMQEDGKWSFSFADYSECPETAGIIQAWGTQQADAGVQRLCISYEPAANGEDYYPHTTYEVIYLYSNVEIDGEYVPQMNYRFETKVASPEGTTTQLIGDWGGEHEWTTEY